MRFHGSAAAWVVLSLISGTVAAGEASWTVQQLEDKVKQELLAEGTSLERLGLALRVREGNEKPWAVTLSDASGTLVMQREGVLAPELEVAAAEVVTMVTGMLRTLPPAQASEGPAASPESPAPMPPPPPPPATAADASSAAWRQQPLEERTAPQHSPWLALSLGYGVTLLAVGAGSGLAFNQDTAPAAALLVSAGLIVGPSVGHFYSGESGRAVAFIGGRLGFLGLAAIGALVGAIEALDVSDPDFGPGIALIYLGGLGFSALAIWEPIDSYFSTARLNEAAGPKLSLAPLFLKARGPAPAAEGLTLALTW